MNYRQVKAIEQKNKKRILEVCDTPETSGVYILTRHENGFKYAYIGQAKHLLTRLAQHLSGYQHIDLSLKKHGLYDACKNPNGWAISYGKFPICELDMWEQHYIQEYAENGYQLRNKTIGGQGKGKQGLDDNKTPKGYYDGKKQGYLDARKYVANLFDKHLKFSQKSDKPNKNQEKAVEKFKEFLDWGETK